MKVLVDGRVLTHSFTTGVQRYTRELLKAFDKIGFTYYDITYPYTKYRYLQHFWEHIFLPLKTKNYDLLFCPGNIAPIWKSANVKMIVTIHSLAFRYFPQAYSKFFRNYYEIVIPRIMKISEKIITVSKAEKKVLSDYFPEYQNKIAVVQNGVDELFINQKLILEKENYLLYVGSLNLLKNLEGMIKAFISISAKVPHTLVIAGSIPPSFRKVDIQTSERIMFINPSNDFQLAKLYSKASLFVFPSFYEASPLPPIEAMACGCPVLVSDITALRERCGDAAIYCNPNDINDIADKILTVLSNKSLTNELISKGLKRASLFSWRKTARETIRIFHTVCNTL